jgi:hypothetical protein
MGATKLAYVIPIENLNGTDNLAELDLDGDSIEIVLKFYV